MCLILRKEPATPNGAKADLHTCQDDLHFPREVYRHDHQVDIILNRTLISKRPITASGTNDHLVIQGVQEGHDNDESRLYKRLKPISLTNRHTKL